MQDLCTLPGFGEALQLQRLLQALWDRLGYPFNARTLPKCSVSVGDNKSLHNDANGTPLTAHVVVCEGARPSHMRLCYGATRIRVAMVRRTVFFNFFYCNHSTQLHLYR